MVCEVMAYTATLLSEAWQAALVIRVCADMCMDMCTDTFMQMCMDLGMDMCMDM